MNFLQRIICNIIEKMYDFEGKDAKFFFSIPHGETDASYGTATGAFTTIRDVAAQQHYLLLNQKQYGAPRDRVAFTYQTHDGQTFMIQYCMDSGFAYSSETISYERVVASQKA